MKDVLARAEQLLDAWSEQLRGDLPADAEIFDAHVHLGDDIDGMAGRREELLGLMDEYGVGRAFMFCLDEADRHPVSARRTTARSPTPRSPTAASSRSCVST